MGCRYLNTSAGGGFTNKPVAGVDFDRDGQGEVVLFSGVNDGGIVQIMEYSESSVKLSVERELTIITLKIISLVKTIQTHSIQPLLYSILSQ